MASLDRGLAREGSVYTTPSNDMDELDLSSRRAAARGPWLGIIAVVIFVAFGATVYVIYRLGVERGMRESPPIVMADREPVRVRPEEPGGLEPPPDRRVYDVMSGNAEKDQAVEQLLPREDEGIDLAAPSGAEAPAPDVGGPAGAREASPELRTEPTPALSQLATAEPEAGAAEEATDSIEIPKPSAALGKPAEAGPPVPAPSPEKAPKVDLPEASPPKAMAPAPSETPPAATKPATVASVAPAAPAKVSGYLVQVGAFFDDALARDAWKEMQAKHAEVLTGQPFDIMRVDLGAKGVWHRLRVGPYAGKAEADALCAKLKSRGQDCLVRKE